MASSLVSSSHLKGLLNSISSSLRVTLGFVSVQMSPSLLTSGLTAYEMESIISCDLSDFEFKVTQIRFVCKQICALVRTLTTRPMAWMPNTIDLFVSICVIYSSILVSHDVQHSLDFQSVSTAPDLPCYDEQPTRQGEQGDCDEKDEQRARNCHCKDGF